VDQAPGCDFDELIRSIFQTTLPFELAMTTRSSMTLSDANFGEDDIDVIANPFDRPPDSVMGDNKASKCLPQFLFDDSLNPLTDVTRAQPCYTVERSRLHAIDLLLDVMSRIRNRADAFLGPFGGNIPAGCRWRPPCRPAPPRKSDFRV
jgi:hypothetical protein